MISAVYYIFLVLLCTFFMILSALALVVCYPFDKGRRVVHELSRILVRTFFAIPPRWRQRVEGARTCRPEEKLRHRAEPQYGDRHPDALLHPAQFPLGLQARGLQDAFLRAVSHPHGDICINRGRASEALEQMVRDGKLWISRGASVAVFPEGTRSKDGEIHRFKAGAFTLAREAGVEILPVVLDGTKTLIRKNAMFNWGNRITIRVLPPVPAAKVVSTETHVLMEEVHDAMSAALAQIRNRK